MITPEQFMINSKHIFTDWIDQAYDNKVLIKTKNDLKKLPVDYGYYVLLCDKPVPDTAKTHKGSQQLYHNYKYLWRDGAGGIRSTLGSRHLFRDEILRLDGTKPNSFKVTQRPLDVFISTEHNFTPCGDGVNGWENGINIEESKWNDHNFYIGYFICENFANILEQVSNEHIGQAPLNLQSKK